MIFLRTFCRSEDFGENEKKKNGTCLVQIPVNVVDRIEHISLNPIFFYYVILAEYFLALSRRSTTFLLLKSV